MAVVSYNVWRALVFKSHLVMYDVYNVNYKRLMIEQVYEFTMKIINGLKNIFGILFLVYLTIQTHWGGKVGLAKLQTHAVYTPRGRPVRRTSRDYLRRHCGAGLRAASSG